MKTDNNKPSNTPPVPVTQADANPTAQADAKSGVSAPTIRFGAAEDPFEAMFDRGWSDGLPLIPPTPERVAKMLEGTSRNPSDIVAVVPPDLVECSVEKVAVNAVMAGCRPEYFPVVLAALEAICTDEFNMHGVLATTMSVGPIIIVNGPIRKRIGMNSAGNVLGQGNRANSTIGRAVQLVVRNVGGGRPGEVDQATLGSPGKLSFCFPEDEENSPWESLSVERGFGEKDSTVTVFAGESPRVIVDQLSRKPESLAKSLAKCLITTGHPNMVLAFDSILVVSPEHAARFRDAGWSKQRLKEELKELMMIDVGKLPSGAKGITTKEGKQMTAKLPKFRDDGLLIVHAGGTAGLFSASICGWASGPAGSQHITRDISGWC